MMSEVKFDYDRAFSRNIGWVTSAEQAKLRQARIGIAGLGGVGGAHLLTLSRLGISRFNIADFDDFDVHNINRQAGASMPHMGQPKIDIMARLAQDINPETDLRLFPQGVQSDNVDEFLRDVDMYVDGLDFFALPARRMVFAKCHEKGILALTAAPLDMGVAFHYFSATGMSRRNNTRALLPVCRQPCSTGTTLWRRRRSTSRKSGAHPPSWRVTCARAS